MSEQTPYYFDVNTFKLTKEKGKERGLVFIAKKGEYRWRFRFGVFLKWGLTDVYLDKYYYHYVSDVAMERYPDVAKMEFDALFEEAGKKVQKYVLLGVTMPKKAFNRLVGDVA